MTLRLDAASQAWFDALRREHFPPERLLVGAHVTMFHALPGEQESNVSALLHRLCRGARSCPVTVAGLRFLGRGVAYALAAPQAILIRAAVARELAGSLTPQDSRAWSPDVTVQNKVSAETARATMALLAGFSPPEPIWATGITLWRYLGGPWEKLADVPFGLDAQCG